MRIAHFLTLAAAAAVSFSASADSGVSTPSSSAAASAATQVTARPIYKLDRAEQQRVLGAYQLEDGRVLHVSDIHGKLYADLDGKRSEIVPTAHNQYASRDDSVRVRFNQATGAGEVAVSVPRG